MKHWTRRLVSLLVAVTFVAAVLAPDRPHEWVPAANAGLTYRPSEAGRHGEGCAPHDRRMPRGDCNCIGHACCGVIPVLPIAERLSHPSVITTSVEPVLRFHGVPLTRPERLLPLAQAPPSVLL